MQYYINNMCTSVGSCTITSNLNKINIFSKSFLYAACFFGTALLEKIQNTQKVWLLKFTPFVFWILAYCVIGEVLRIENENESIILLESNT